MHLFFLFSSSVDKVVLEELANKIAVRRPKLK